MAAILPLSSWSCQKRIEPAKELQKFNIELKKFDDKQKEKAETKLSRYQEYIIQESMDELADYSDVEFTDEEIATIKAGGCLSCDIYSEDPNMRPDNFKHF
jgi:hypothetical protein